jgi:hypothetical protein
MRPNEVLPESHIFVNYLQVEALYIELGRGTGGMRIDPALKNLDFLFPENFSEEQKARAKTFFCGICRLKRSGSMAGRCRLFPNAVFPGSTGLTCGIRPAFPKFPRLSATTTKLFGFSRKTVHSRPDCFKRTRFPRRTVDGTLLSIRIRSVFCSVALPARPIF